MSRLLKPETQTVTLRRRARKRIEQRRLPGVTSRNQALFDQQGVVTLSEAWLTDVWNAIFTAADVEENFTLEWVQLNDTGELLLPGRRGFQKSAWPDDVRNYVAVLADLDEQLKSRHEREATSKGVRNETHVLHSFLADGLCNIVFIFGKAHALEHFARLLKALYIAPESPGGRVHVSVRLLDDWYFDALDTVTEEEGQYSEQDYRLGSNWTVAAHIYEWMEVIDNLPNYIDVHIQMMHPWRNYIYLWWLVKPFRDRKGPTLVMLDMPKWNGPREEVDKMITVAAFEGIPIEPILSQGDIDNSLFKGLWVG